MSDDEKRKQVAAQCRAVVHLAKALAEVHSDYEQIFLIDVPYPLDVVGERTAAFMEMLGDMLNAMDACTEEDEFLAPVFAEARRLWPVARSEESERADG